MLLYQFHDILPGSSIDRVYTESVERYEAILQRLHESIYILANKLFGEGLLNLNPFCRNGIFRIGENWYAGDVPAMGFLPVSQMEKVNEFTVQATQDTIENNKLRVAFKDGCIVSLFDKDLGYEFVKKGEKMGVFSDYTDVGDCWDIRPVHYQKTRRNAVCISFEACTDGAIAVAKAKFELGRSVLEVCYILKQGSELLEIEIKIDCRQKKRMMRVAFPVNIESDVCSFNIPFGHLYRKTTENNSVEKAQYEVSGQKFVDISVARFGFSLLNDCKYGYRCKGHTIDVDLIRTPAGGLGTDVDRGVHTLKLAVYTHVGSLNQNTYRHSYEVNNELLLLSGTGRDDRFAPYVCDNENIVLEAVKIAEDNSGAVVRLYNCSENLEKCSVGFEDYQVAGITNIMEDACVPSGDVLEFRPFELKLLKIVKP